MTNNLSTAGAFVQPARRTEGANTMGQMARRPDSRTTRTATRALAATLLGALAVLLAACGSQTKTVTAASSPSTTETATTATTETTAAPTHTTTTQTTTTPAQTSTAGGTSAPATTHTAPEPEFTEHESHSASLNEAEAVLQARGYAAAEPSQYHANQTLRVLVGTRAGSSDGYGQQAFFFVDGRYLGTDTKEPSATVKVLAQSDTEVTLGYPLYRPGDPLSSPSGGQATVRFQLDDGKLTPLGTIPPASSTTALSRN